MRFITGGGAYSCALELVVQGVADGVEDVEADEIAQRQGAHGVTGAESHSVIDVLPTGETLFVHSHRSHEVRDQQKVDDEAGSVLGLDGMFT